MQRRRKNRWNVYLGLAVSAACIVWIFQSVDPSQIAELLRNVDPGQLVLAFATMSLSYFLRSVRWRDFFRFNPPRLYQSYRCLIIGFFCNNILPARMGELVRAHVGSKACNQSRTHVLATIAAERLFDGLTISLMFAIIFPLFASPNESQEQGGIYYVAALFLLAGLATVAVILLRHPLFRLLEALNRKIPGKASTYTLTRIGRFIEGLEPILRPQTFFKLSLMSALIWFVELTVYVQVSRSFGVRLGAAEVTLFLAVVNFSSLIPSAPGAIGVIEAVSTVALEHVGVPRSTALAMVGTQHLMQMLVIGIPGTMFFFFGGEKIEVEPDTDEADPEPQQGQQVGAAPTA